MENIIIIILGAGLILLLALAIAESQEKNIKKFERDLKERQKRRDLKGGEK